MLCNNCGIENDEGQEVCRSCGLRIAPAASEKIVHSMVAAKVLYAGFWKRAAAIMIDFVLLILVSFVVGVIFIVATGSDEGLESASNIFGLLLYWLYFALMESSEAQATIGKRALGIIVTDKYGKRLTFYRASGRHFGKIVSSITLGVGFIMAGFTKKKQTLHDMMFDCFVVVKN
jgi:uncharacterized RDD family membrane protein YckC